MAMRGHTEVQHTVARYCQLREWTEIGVMSEVYTA